MTTIFSRTAAAAAFMLLSAGGALAQSYPTGITGTWTIRANNTELFTFAVDTQSTDAPCAAITGTMGAPNDTIAGYYCPATGGVSFLRNSAQTGATYQVFTGQLSWTGAKTYMNGTFTNYAGSGNTGAYGFTAYIQKKS
jgi:hypothetical protein